MFISLFFFVVFLIFLDLVNITNFIPLSNNYDWLSFIGSICGGILTLYGVLLTINYQSIVNEEKDRLLNIPIFEYDIKYNQEDFYKPNNFNESIISNIYLEGSPDDDMNIFDELNVTLHISNIGSGHGQIVSIILLLSDSNDNTFFKTDNFGYLYYLVKKGEFVRVKFILKNKKEIKKLYPLDIIIKYKDILGNIYYQVIHAHVLYDNFGSCNLSYFDTFSYNTIPFDKLNINHYPKTEIENILK